MNDDFQFQQQCQTELVYSEDVPISSDVSSATAGIHDESLDSSGITRYGFVLVMDNVDKNIRPNFQHENKGTRSYHFTHSYAVQTELTCLDYLMMYQELSYLLRKFCQAKMILKC